MSNHEYAARVVDADGTVLDETSKPRSERPQWAWNVAAAYWRTRHPESKLIVLQRPVGSNDEWQPA